MTRILALAAAMLTGPTLSVSGMQPGIRYSIQTSTDLVTWQTRWNVVGDGTEKCYMVDGGGPRFFYRVVTQPRFRATRPPAPRGTHD